MADNTDATEDTATSPPKTTNWLKRSVYNLRIIRRDEIETHRSRWRLIEIFAKISMPFRSLKVFSRHQRELAAIVAEHHINYLPFFGDLRKALQDKRDVFEVDVKNAGDPHGLIHVVSSLSQMTDIFDNTQFKRKQVISNAGNVKDAWTLPLNEDSGLHAFFGGHWLSAHCDALFKDVLKNCGYGFECFSDAQIGQEDPKKDPVAEFDFICLIGQILLTVECKSGKAQNLITSDKRGETATTKTLKRIIALKDALQAGGFTDIKLVSYLAMPETNDLEELGQRHALAGHLAEKADAGSVNIALQTPSGIAAMIARGVLMTSSCAHAVDTV